MQVNPSQKTLIASCSGVSFFREFNCVIAETSPFRKFILLGMFSKKVVINPGTKSITVYRKQFWLNVEPIHIEFDWIAAILFDDKIHDSTNSYSSYRRYNAFSETVDLETVSIRIALKDQRVIRTFTLATASSTNDISTFLSSDYGNPLSGQILSQDGTHSVALLFANALSTMTGAPISKSLNI